MTASVNNLTGKVHAGMPQMRQIGRRLVAWGGWIAAFCRRSDQLRSARVLSPGGTRAGLQGVPTVGDGHLHRKDDNATDT